MKVYKWALLLVLIPAAAAAADDAAVAMRVRAQTDFDRVTSAAFPELPDTTRCVQSQAVLLPVVGPAGEAVVRFRMGWCQLLGASLTDSRAAYGQAAREFARAMAAWPARSLEPIPAPLQVLSGISRLQQGAEPHSLPDIRAGFEAALATRSCPDELLSPRVCQEVIALARLWLGWTLLEEGKLADATVHLLRFPELGWADWSAGRQALEWGRARDAADRIGQAVERWTAARKYPRGGTLRLLAPKPDLPRALAELGMARYLAGDFAGAVQSLDAAVKQRPWDARSIFTRGLARDALGQTEAALADYQLASRTAFANPGLSSASAQAHLYRGVWHFRRGAWTRAEDEFAGALNARPEPALRADIAAWRHLSAVAGGACESSAAELGRALSDVSGLFPREEAQARLAACARPPATISSRE